MPEVQVTPRYSAMEFMELPHLPGACAAGEHQPHPADQRAFDCEARLRSVHPPYGLYSRASDTHVVGFNSRFCHDISFQ